jgi:hypothetical protein
MSYSRLVKLNKIKEEALARGDQETADKAQQFMDNLQQDFSLAAEETKGLSEPIVEKQREAQSTYNKNLDRSKKLDRIIQKAERELDQETLDTALQMKLQVDDEIRRHEGIEGDIVGASLAITEGITGGIIGDEVSAYLGSKITGVPYDAMLEYYRDTEQQFAEKNPGGDIGLRVAGGLAPGAMLSRAAGVGKTFAGGFGRQAGVTGAEVGTYAFMEGEGGFQPRLQAVGQALTDPLFGGVVGLAGTVGGVGGRAIGRGERLERQLVEAAAQEEKRVKGIRQDRGITSGENLIKEVQPVMDRIALNHYNTTGEMLSGPALGRAYQQAAEETGLNVGSIIRSEMAKGVRKSTLDYRGQSIEDLRKRVKTNAGDTFFTPEQIAQRKRNFVSNFYEDKMRPLVNVAKDRVGGAFGGNMQRLATKMAQQQQTFEEVFNSKPVLAFAREIENDSTGVLKKYILNFSNSNLTKEVREKQFESFKEAISERGLEGYEALMKIRRAQEGDYRTYVSRELPDDSLYFPSRVLSPEKPGILQRRVFSKRSADENLEERTRGFVRSQEAKELYENPLVVLKDKMARDAATIEMHRTFGLENASNRIKKADTDSAGVIQESLKAGRYSFEELKRVLKDEGAQEGTAEVADELLSSLIVQGTKGPNSFIANARKFGYIGTIGNPYSAFLNLGDLTNSVVNYGADNTADAIVSFLRRKGQTVTVDDVGLAKQATGEFLREGATKWNRRFNDVSDFTFKASGFQAADMAGKNVSLTAALKRGKQKAIDGSLEADFGWLFGPTEMRLLKRDLITERKTQRVKEFAAAELARIQPADLAQMPKWYLDNPNGRILYMLRTFGLKQIQQIENLVFNTYKEGVKQNNNKKKAEAIKNGLAYLTIVGGGNVLLNELRQPIKGKEPFEIDHMQRYATDFALGLVSVNTLSSYNLERLSEKDAVPLLLSVIPAPVSGSMDIIEDLAGLITGEDDLEDVIFEGKGIRWLPFMRIAQPFLEEEFD